MAPKKSAIHSSDTPRDRALWRILLSETRFLAEERWARLLLNKEIISISLDRIRKSLHIPSSLNPSKDTYASVATVSEFGEIDLKESHWRDTLESKEKIALDAAINALIIEHGLTIDFEEHLLYWLLYREPPNWIAPLGIEHMFHATSEQLSELDRMPLNTAEKKYLLFRFRDVRGIKNGRIPIQYAADYTTLLKRLRGSKNKQRRSRTYKMASAAILFRTSSGKQKRSFLDIIAELHPVTGDEHIPSEEEDRRAASTLRAQTSRFLRRGKKNKPEK